MLPGSPPTARRPCPEACLPASLHWHNAGPQTNPPPLNRSSVRVFQHFFETGFIPKVTEQRAGVAGLHPFPSQPRSLPGKEVYRRKRLSRHRFRFKVKRWEGPKSKEAHGASRAWGGLSTLAKGIQANAQSSVRAFSKACISLQRNTHTFTEILSLLSTKVTLEQSGRPLLPPSSPSSPGHHEAS